MVVGHLVDDISLSTWQPAVGALLTNFILGNKLLAALVTNFLWHLGLRSRQSKRPQRYVRRGLVNTWQSGE
jgi:hypothetical protein